MFGQRTAPAIARYVERARKIGVSFGRQLASVAQGMWELADTRSVLAARPDLDAPPAVIFPVWGDACLPVKQWSEPLMASEISASGVAETMHAAMFGSTGHALTLRNVPVLWPAPIPREVFAQALRFHAHPLLSDYVRIFGESSVRRFEERPKPRSGDSVGADAREGLVWEMDCLLLTIGGPQPAGRFWSREFFTLMESGCDDGGERGASALEKIKRVAIGDIGGIWLYKDKPLGDSPEWNAARQLVQDMTDHRWAGVQEPMVRKCVADAARSSKANGGQGIPGVIALCVGGTRAESAIRAAVSGLCNRLIVDSDCAEAMIRVLKAKQKF